MTQLTIHLFGGLITEQDGEPIPKLVSRKADLLLAYLAQEPRPHSRESLATLLWDDRPQKQALSNLRTLISSLRKHADAFVTITRQTLEIQAEVQVDTAVFTQQLAALQEDWPSAAAVTQMEQTLKLYVGDFLHGVLVSSSLEMEDWIQFTREQLRQKVMDARQQLVAYYLQQGQPNDGIRHTAILLEMDPWDEETHRQMMKLFVRNGQRQAALAQYETCVAVLDEELGIPPEPETTALYERIQTAVSTPASNLPAITTTFVGREQELSRCLTQLRDPDCRLLTLLGLGGMGKTRLALKAADTLQMDFLNGVYFVPLATVDSPSSLATAVLETLPISFYDTVDIETQLLNFLRGKEMLLVLDNFEHLLAGANLVAKIIREAPAVKLLVTSRIRLDLRPEWLLELGGLPYPVAETAVTPSPENYAATLLFDQRARVIAPDFSLTPENLPSINRICRIVHGIPLGIELAAAWVRFLPIDHIAQHLEQSLDLLATTMRDVPERQRSLTAVFDYVWSLLDEEEQTIFAELSVFRSSFDVNAFQTVTNGSPWILASLVEKSLLHQETETKRYTIIEALRLYATSKLAQSPEQQAQTQQVHSHYYATLLHQQESLLQSYDTQPALAVIRRDLENIHAAWAYAVSSHTFADLALSHESLAQFYIYQGPYQEGEMLLVTAVDQLLPLLQDDADPDPEHVRTLAQLYNNRAKLAHFTANFDAGIVATHEAIAWSEKIQDQHALANGYLNLGRLTSRKGEHETAVTHLQQAITLAQEVDDSAIEAEGHRLWGNCLHRQSQYEAAREQHTIGLTIARRIQQPQIIASCLRGLGNVSRISGEHTVAHDYYEEAVVIAREMGDLVALHAGLINLANVASATGDYAAASNYYRQVLPFYQQMGNRYMEATCLVNLGGSVFQLNQFQVAQNLYQQALGFACEIGNQWMEHVALINLTEVLNRLGHFHQALEHGHDAVRYFEETGENMARNHALMGVGEALVGLNQLDEAETVLQETLTIRRQFKNKVNIMGAVAELSRVYVAQGDTEQAVATIEEIMQFLQDDHLLVGSDQTLRIFEACYLVLHTANDPRSDTILQLAYDELQARTSRIQDDAVQQDYLESTSWHRTILQAYTVS